jgi:hypothetical protein
MDTTVWLVLTRSGRNVITTRDREDLTIAQPNYQLQLGLDVHDGYVDPCYSNLDTCIDCHERSHLSGEVDLCREVVYVQPE